METAVFLDFDGVICDSTLECLTTSWLAYRRYLGGEPPAAMPVGLRSRFARLRPFARSGEDFVLFQELLDRGIELNSQEEFDRECSARGQELLGRYREEFDNTRAELLAADREYWIGLNRIYPHLRARLPVWACSACFYILSTKRPVYIEQILRSSGIEMNPERILHCSRSGKLHIVSRLMSEKGIRNALFVDDQIDHLQESLERAPEGGRIEAVLASWGYVIEDWLAGTSGVEVLQPVDLIPRVDSLLESCASR